LAFENRGQLPSNVIPVLETDCLPVSMRVPQIWSENLGDKLSGKRWLPIQLPGSVPHRKKKGT
jgi:hypothetical protein